MKQQKITSNFLVPRFFTVPLLMLVCAGSALSQRMYDSSGRQMGRVDSERYYDSSGRRMGLVDGERIYDGSGHQVGRADGFRRIQIIIYFFYVVEKLFQADRSILWIPE
jgi:hypothetical protein